MPAARATILPCPKPATPPPPLALRAESSTHRVQVTVPDEFDFTLASVTLAGPATGLHVTVMGPHRIRVGRGGRSNRPLRTPGP